LFLTVFAIRRFFNSLPGCPTGDCASHTIATPVQYNSTCICMHVITLCAVYSGTHQYNTCLSDTLETGVPYIVSCPLFIPPPETENVIFLPRALRGYEPSCLLRGCFSNVDAFTALLAALSFSGLSYRATVTPENRAQSERTCRSILRKSFHQTHTNQVSYRSPLPSRVRTRSKDHFHMYIRASFA